MINILSIVQDAQNNLYDTCDLKIKDFNSELESLEYYAHVYYVKSKSVRFRIAKKTPKKVGWFVTLWKRVGETIAPYDASDSIDIVASTILDRKKIGQFIFPKEILLQKKILSVNNKGGKRAIRVYSPWDKVVSLQAIKSQKWQEKYFVNLDLKNIHDIEKVKKLYR